MKTKRIVLALLLATALAIAVAGGARAGERPKIEWIALEEALAKAAKDPRPILIDLYTDWCGYCKRMDAYTFTNKGIVSYISENYYAVKFNAERRDTVAFQGKSYQPAQQGGRSGAHELALALTGGKLSYPTMVYLDEKGQLITAVPGYQPPSEIEPILHFFATGAYKSQEWKSFKEGFKSQL